MTSAAHDSNSRIELDDTDIEGRARKALFAAWRKLDRAQRPTQPRKLVQLLLNCFVWPVPDFYPAPNVRYDLELAADANLKRFIQAAIALRADLPRSHNYYVLSSLMEARLPGGQPGDDAAERLHQLEDWLRSVNLDFSLKPRPNRSRPGHIKDPYVRWLVRAVFWYILHVEKQQPTQSFTGSPPTPTSRAGILALVTVDALSYSSKGIKRHVEEVMLDTAWRCESFDAWQNLPIAA